MNLGINGLNVPRHSIQSAVYNHRDNIKDAAYAVISEWALQYETKSMAYVNIIAGLQKCKMLQLLTELRQWAEGEAFTEQISKESKFNISRMHLHCIWKEMQPCKLLLNVLQE